MKSLRINIEDTATAEKLRVLLGLFTDDIEIIGLKAGTLLQNKGDEYEKFVAQVLFKKDFKVIQTDKIFLTADHKVDLIAFNANNFLIQCKDYIIDNPYQIEKQEIIDMEQYIDKFIDHYVWIDEGRIQVLGSS